MTEVPQIGAREIKTTKGFIPFGDKRIADEMRNGIRRTGELIEKTLVLPYSIRKKRKAQPHRDRTHSSSK